MDNPAGWHVERREGGAGELHHAELDLSRRGVVVQLVDRPALVLGSTQPEGSVEPDVWRREGLIGVRRRSGGGAVLLVPGQHLWFDVIVPADDPLHDDDVGRSSWWLGEAVAAAVRDLTRRGQVEVHRGALGDRELGRLVCFAAVGPGEVTVDGAKFLGLSQRRTRVGSRFQCVIHHRWDPFATSELIRAGGLGPALDAALERVTTTVALGVAAEDMLAAVLHHLPPAG